MIDETQLRGYATLIVRIGINLRPGQSVSVISEVAHRDFALLVVEACYQHGARLVQVHWSEPRITRARLKLATDETALDQPAYEHARIAQMRDERWASIYLSGEEFPGLLEDVDPQRLKHYNANLRRTSKPYSDERMANRAQWCIAGVPTPAWAAKVFPELPPAEALDALWHTVLRMTRTDQPDPLVAWTMHASRLQQVGAYLMREHVRKLHLYDPAPGPDGKASSDLRIGLTPSSIWETAAFRTPDGLTFVANIPSEETFTTPHWAEADGWVRSSRPIFPLDREVRGAYFRFENGECVAFEAEHGLEVLHTFFEVPGTRRLGEIALVDTRSPVNQVNRVFFDTLYDENAACHIAFGAGLDMCVPGAIGASVEQKKALGVNQCDLHEDFMIGTRTMSVTGQREDGSTVPVMHDGQFVDAIFAN